MLESWNFLSFVLVWFWRAMSCFPRVSRPKNPEKIMPRRLYCSRAAPKGTVATASCNAGCVIKLSISEACFELNRNSLVVHNVTFVPRKFFLHATLWLADTFFCYRKSLATTAASCSCISCEAQDRSAKASKKWRQHCFPILHFPRTCICY